MSEPEDGFVVPEIWPIPPRTDSVVYSYGPDPSKIQLHPSLHLAGDVWGCQVEDPHIRVSIDGRCPGCRIAAEARYRYWMAREASG